MSLFRGTGAPGGLSIFPTWVIVVFTVLWSVCGVSAQPDEAERLTKKAHAVMLESFSSTPGAFEPAHAMSGVGSESRQQAIALFTEALNADPDYADALVGRSTAYRQEGEIEKAKADARRALKLGVKDSDFLFLSFPFEGDEAREILQQGIDEMEQDSPFRRMLVEELARTYWYEQNYLKQAELLEELGPEADDRTFYYERLGMAYYAAGNLEKAESNYQKGLPESALSLVHLKMHQGEFEEALRVLESQAGEIEDDEYLVEKAVLNALLGREVDHERALELVRESGEANLFGQDDFQAGVLEYDRGNKRLGRQLLRRSMAMLDSNPLEWGVTLAWKREVAKRYLHSESETPFLLSKCYEFLHSLVDNIVLFPRHVLEFGSYFLPIGD